MQLKGRDTPNTLSRLAGLILVSLAQYQISYFAAFQIRNTFSSSWPNLPSTLLAARFCRNLCILAEQQATVTELGQSKPNRRLTSTLHVAVERFEKSHHRFFMADAENTCVTPVCEASLYYSGSELIFPRH